MKKGIFIIGSLMLLSACGGASEDQKNAASDICDCMDENTFGDDEINYYECDLEVSEKYPTETFSDEGWSTSLEEGCPSVAAMLEESE